MQRSKFIFNNSVCAWVGVEAQWLKHEPRTRLFEFESRWM